MNKLRKTMLSTVLALTLALPLTASAQSSEDLATMQQFLGIMQNYFGIIESTYDVSSEPEKAAILQMMKIQEVYEQRGEKARAASVFRQVLEDSNNATIRNAAYMLLGDLLKETGNADQALELLERGLAENVSSAN